MSDRIIDWQPGQVRNVVDMSIAPLLPRRICSGPQQALLVDFWKPLHRQTPTTLENTAGADLPQDGRNSAVSDNPTYSTDSTFERTESSPAFAFVKIRKFTCSHEHFRCGVGKIFYGVTARFPVPGKVRKYLLIDTAEPRPSHRLRCSRPSSGLPPFR